MSLYSKGKNKIKEIASFPLDWYRRIVYGTPEIKSIEETINKIIADHCSVSRYGDGELEIMRGRSIDFQIYNDQLAEKMREILHYDSDNFLVCLPDSFKDDPKVKSSSRQYWKKYMRSHRGEWLALLKNDKTYWNAYISRFYMQFLDKSQGEKYVLLLKEIWDQRDLVIVEGEKSRLGVGNDLFLNAKSIQRILCPANNAFDVYDRIIDEIKTRCKEQLILIALGPTATALAFDLYQLGYQAIDIGHIDIEYEWMRMGARSKLAVKGKYTNEAVNIDGKIVEDVNNAEYEKSIISIIK